MQRTFEFIFAAFICVALLLGCGKDKKKSPPADSNKSAKQITKKEPPKIEPGNPTSAAAIEAGIRASLEKPRGALTPEDYAKVTSLYLPHDGIDDLRMIASLPNLEELSIWNNKITDLTPLAGLTKLQKVILYDNPDLTRTEIDQLQAALPECVIRHNSKKF